MQNGLEGRTTGWVHISKLFSEAKIMRVSLMLILGALGSVPLVFLTPPFQVPDEAQHFFRAYEISELNIRAEVQNGVAGATLPDSIPELVKSSSGTRDFILFPVRPSPLTVTLKLASMPLNSSARHFIAFTGSAFYSPLPYIPQVLGIAVGRWFGLGPLYLFYLGRLVNCLTALALSGLAVYLMPFAGELVMVVGLLPMSLFLWASLSPDASVISCALLFIALSFAASSRGNWRTWELVMAATAAAVLCSVKPVYAPLLLAGVVPALLRGSKAAIVVRVHAILLAVALGFAAGWLFLARSTMTTLVDAGHPSLQMPFILHHPIFFVHVLVHTLGIRTIYHLYIETVGVLGWLTVFIHPVIVYLLPLINFWIVWKWGTRGSANRSVLSALWYLTLTLASVALILTAMYMMSAKVGQDEVTGLQGRYFIPILVLAGMSAMELAPGRRPSSAGWTSLAWIAAFVVAQIVAVDVTTIRAFQVF